MCTTKDEAKIKGGGGISIFKRIAREPFEVGDVINGSGTKPLQSRFPEIEEVLERNRPHSVPDRGNCVFMRDDADFSQTGVSFDKGYVHDVEPIGSVRKRDTYWIGVLQKRHFKDARFQKNIEPILSDDEVAQNYWGCKAGPNPIWEWVAESAKVISVAADPVLVRPNAIFLNANFDEEK